VAADRRWMKEARRVMQRGITRAGPTAGAGSRRSGRCWRRERGGSTRGSRDGSFGEKDDCVRKMIEF
jgi:hypothetical protein